MMSTGETMERVRVKPDQLISELEKNFDRHKKEYQTACKAYRKKAAELLNQRLIAIQDSIKDGAVPDLRFDLEPPDDHTKDYERAIAMLKMSQDDTVTVTSVQFAAFVQDDWSWKESFLVKNSRY